MSRARARETSRTERQALCPQLPTSSVLTAGQGSAATSRSSIAVANVPLQVLGVGTGESRLAQTLALPILNSTDEQVLAPNGDYRRPSPSPRGWQPGSASAPSGRLP